MEDDIKFEYNIKPEEFLEMIKSVGWKTYSKEQTIKALKNSMYLVKVNVGGELAGIGRVIGDGSICCMLSSVCVKPEFQKRGIGAAIVEELKKLVENGVKTGEKMQIEVMPTAGNESIYKKAGFKYKPDVALGMYLWIEK